MIFLAINNTLVKKRINAVYKTSATSTNEYTKQSLSAMYTLPINKINVHTILYEGIP